MQAPWLWPPWSAALGGTWLPLAVLWSVGLQFQWVWIWRTHFNTEGPHPPVTWATFRGQGMFMLKDVPALVGPSMPMGAQTSFRIWGKWWTLSLQRCPWVFVIEDCTDKPLVLLWNYIVNPVLRLRLWPPLTPPQRGPWPSEHLTPTQQKQSKQGALVIVLSQEYFLYSGLFCHILILVQGDRCIFHTRAGGHGAPWSCLGRWLVLALHSESSCTAESELPLPPFVSSLTPCYP